MFKRIILGVSLLAGLNSFAAADAAKEYMQRKKVIVNTAKAELCFTDDAQCYPVLIGKTTPKGTFDMQLMKTSKPGYGAKSSASSRKKTSSSPCTASGRSNPPSAVCSASLPTSSPTASSPTAAST